MSYVGGLVNNFTGGGSLGMDAANVLTLGGAGVVNAATGGQAGKSLAGIDPTNPSKSNAGYAAAQGANTQENAANQSTLGSLGSQTNQYIGGLSTAAGQEMSASSAANAQNQQGYQNQYNQYNPQYQQLTTQATGNAAGAETLQQLQNPNSNPWAQNVQSAYNTQAQGIQNQGLADYGVLAGLGSQATANTLGSSGIPFTGGQAEAVQGANLSGATGEFSAAQNQASQLRNAGLQAGINQANTAYGYGQQAQQQASSALGTQQGFQNTVQQGQYNSSLANAQNNYNVQNQLSNSTIGAQTGMANAQLGQNDLFYGSQESLDTGQAAAAQAQNASTLGAITGVIGQGVGAAVGNITKPAAATATAAAPAAQNQESLSLTNPYGAASQTASTAQVQGGYGGQGYTPGASTYNYNPYGNAA